LLIKIKHDYCLVETFPRVLITIYVRDISIRPFRRHLAEYSFHYFRCNITAYSCFDVSNCGGDTWLLHLYGSSPRVGCVTIYGNHWSTVHASLLVTGFSTVAIRLRKSGQVKESCWQEPGRKYTLRKP